MTDSVSMPSPCHGPRGCTSIACIADELDIAIVLLDLDRCGIYPSGYEQKRRNDLELR